MNVIDLREFYASRIGRVVKRLVMRRILSLTGIEMKNRNVVGYGYATPYLKPFIENGAFVCALMPSGTGADMWPKSGSHNHGGLVALCDETMLPLETSETDVIVCAHTLECADNANALMQELARILKSGGTLVMVAPVRSAMWARFDHTPFGYGRPYSFAQLRRLMRDHMFIIERVDHALVMPPFDARWLLRIGPLLDKSDWLRRFFGGVMVVTATRRTYAGVAVTADARSPVPVRTKPVAAERNLP